MAVHVAKDGTVTVAPLPQFGVRQDTGQLVADLAGAGAGRQRACGWYNLDELDPDALRELTVGQRQAIRQAVNAAKAERTQRLQWLLTTSSNAADVRSYASDWIDAYGAGTPPIPGYPNPGANWAAASAAERLEAVRRMATVNAFAVVMLSNAVEVAYRLLFDLLRDTPIEVPT